MEKKRFNRGEKIRCYLFDWKPQELVVKRSSVVVATLMRAIKEEKELNIISRKDLVAHRHSLFW